MTPAQIKVTPEELRAIRSLKRLAKQWPSTLMIFAHGGPLSVRRIPPDGSLYGPDWEIDSINGIRNDGGDGGDKS